MLRIYEKHPPFACIYTKSFALIRESYAFIRESFALIRESYAFIRESYALIRESYAFIRESFALIRESFALFRESYAFIRESFALFRESYAFIRESYALIREKYNFFLYENEPNRLSYFSDVRNLRVFFLKWKHNFCDFSDKRVLECIISLRSIGIIYRSFSIHRSFCIRSAPVPYCVYLQKYVGSKSSNKRFLVNFMTNSGEIPEM